MYTTLHLLFYGVLIFHDSSCIRLKQSARNVNCIYINNAYKIRYKY